MGQQTEYDVRSPSQEQQDAGVAALWDAWLWRWPSGLAGDGEGELRLSASCPAGAARLRALRCSSRTAAALALGTPQVLPQGSGCCRWFVAGAVGVMLPCPEPAVLGFADSSSVFVTSDQVRAVLLGRTPDKDPRVHLNINCVCVSAEVLRSSCVKYWQFMNDVHAHLLIAV